MIFVGIDDTDILGARGTNQLARAIVRQAADRWLCRSIVRHQLLFDSQIPYTSKNGSASISLQPRNGATQLELINLCRTVMRNNFIPGSDPGLCVVQSVPVVVTEFGRRCQREVVTQTMTRDLAEACGVFLEGLGGTEGGVIGALAAVGLAATGDDGRIVQWESWPDDLSGWQSVAELNSRDIVVRDAGSNDMLQDGIVDIGKHLRPNLRGGRAVLFVESTINGRWTALKLT